MGDGESYEARQDPDLEGISEALRTMARATRDGDLYAHLAEALSRFAGTESVLVMSLSHGALVPVASRPEAIPATGVEAFRAACERALGSADARDLAGDSMALAIRLRDQAVGAAAFRVRGDATRRLGVARLLVDQAGVAIENLRVLSRSVTDPLTGIFNHAHVERRLAEEIARASRHGGACAALAVRIDGLAALRRSCGDDAADRVLLEAASTIRSALRQEDIAGRVAGSAPFAGRSSGDEFVLVLPSIGREGAGRAAERLLEALRRTTPAEPRTASMGGAVYPDDARDARGLLARAVEALTAAERAGGDRFVPFALATVSRAEMGDLEALVASSKGREAARLVESLVESSHDLQETVERALDAAVRLTGAERGFLLLQGANGGIQVRASRRIPGEDLAPGRFEVSFGVLTHLLREGRPLRVRRVRDDARFANHESVRLLGLTAVLAAPVPGKEAAGGVLYLDSTSAAKEFSAEDEEIAVRLASLLARVLRPASLAHLRTRETEELRRALEAGLKDLQARYRFESLAGVSRPMERLRVQLDHIVRFPYPVLIEGETGVGKEVVAKAIHANSPRRDFPLVAINCSALARDLLESELFGHVKGAFTGADRERLGLFRLADKGTLFLDEITETTDEFQRKLLRVLQEGEFTPVGAAATERTDVRVIAATNRSVERAIREGRFREDLYFRLKVFHVVIPPLRDRREDIPHLAQRLLERIAAEGPGLRRVISSDALRVLEKYPWPGNVRELDNALRRATAFSHDEIRPDHLPPEVLQAGTQSAAIELARRAGTELKPLDGLWRAVIEQTLEEHGWNRSAAAKALGISRVTLHRKINEFGLKPPPEATGSPTH